MARISVSLFEDEGTRFLARGMEGGLHLGIMALSAALYFVCGRGAGCSCAFFDWVYSVHRRHELYHQFYL